MDGWEVLRHLRADPVTAAVRVCIVSAHVPREYERLLAADLGAECYLVKPLPPSELLREIVALIGAESAAGGPVGGAPP
ncbi:MAG TPA: hypothetical protein VHG28_15220, partial [Longimicrobiaceae bacterium]|nr:hypothetical protein [Longimicrobiaceae bacterium]